MPIEQLGANPSFLRQLVEAVPGAVYAKDRAGRILFGNVAFAEAVGRQTGGYLGKDDLDLLSDKDLARAVMDNDQRIMASQSRYQVEEQLRAEDGSTTYWLSTKAPFADENGNIVGLVGVSLDITERKRLEERERLLAREIEHRSKNLLGVVQSIVQLTRAGTTEEFRRAVGGRLEALNRAHGVLLRDRSQQASLRHLLVQELSAYSINAGRARLSGPPVHVGRDVAHRLAMAFHELATNAAKYGAFADVAGKLHVNWELRQHPEQLIIEWREKGGPPVKTPTRRGFGTRLIRTVVEQQLQGTLDMRWEPVGLRCSISLPLENIAPGRMR